MAVTSPIPDEWSGLVAGVRADRDEWRSLARDVTRQRDRLLRHNAALAQAVCSLFDMLDADDEREFEAAQAKVRRALTVATEGGRS